MAKIHTITLTTLERDVLDTVLEFYIRLGLGQISEIATRIRLLSHKRPPLSEEVTKKLNELEADLFKDERPWRLEDEETSANTIAAFAIQAKLQENMANLEWAAKRLREMRGEVL